MKEAPLLRRGASKIRNTTTFIRMGGSIVLRNPPNYADLFSKNFNNMKIIALIIEENLKKIKSES